MDSTHIPLSNIISNAIGAMVQRTDKPKASGIAMTYHIPDFPDTSYDQENSLHIRLCSIYACH